MANTSSSFIMLIGACSVSCVLGTAQAEACGSGQHSSAHLYYNWYNLPMVTVGQGEPEPRLDGCVARKKTADRKRSAVGNREIV